jgi:Fe2+ transport system protein FeoA
MHGGHEFQHRMAEMGLLPGVRFRVISHARYGPIIISVKDTRLMLGRGMARRVMVRPCQ